MATVVADGLNGHLAVHIILLWDDFDDSLVADDELPLFFNHTFDHFGCNAGILVEVTLHLVMNGMECISSESHIDLVDGDVLKSTFQHIDDVCQALGGAVDVADDAIPNEFSRRFAGICLDFNRAVGTLEACRSADG